MDNYMKCCRYCSYYENGMCCNSVFLPVVTQYDPLYIYSEDDDEYIEVKAEDYTDIQVGINTPETFCCNLYK